MISDQDKANLYCLIPRLEMCDDRITIEFLYINSHLLQVVSPKAMSNEISTSPRVMAINKGFKLQEMSSCVVLNNELFV